MEDEEERPPPPGRPWLSWAVLAVAAAGALWLALLPLDALLPEPERPERVLDLDEAEAPAALPPAAPGASEAREGNGPAAPEPEAATTPSESAPGAVVEEPVPPPGAWFEETVPPDDELSVAPPGLRDTIQRQLAMNGIDGVRVEIVGDRIVTSGALTPRDRERLGILLRALAPELHHEDHTAPP
jgi:hypothetical protein